MAKWKYQCTTCDIIFNSQNSDDAKDCKEKNHELMKVPTEDYKKQISKEINTVMNHSFVTSEKDRQITRTILDHKIQVLRPQTLLNELTWKMILVYLPTKKQIIKGNGDSTVTSYEFVNSAYFVISKPKSALTDDRIVLPFDDALLIDKFKINVLPEWNDVRWDQKDCMMWLSQKGKVNPLKLYNLLDETTKTYLEYDPIEYIKFNLWNIGTYFFELFDAFPYNDFTGTKRAGKTKSLEFQKLVCFNAIMSPDATSSAIFRIIEGMGATILLDETESFKNKKDEQAQAVRNILLQGFLKDQTALRNETSKDRNFTPTQYNLYSPKSLAHINALDDVLEDRCISQICKRALDEDIKNSWCTVKDPRFQIIRNMCYRLFLDYADEIIDLQEEARSKLTVSGREMQLWLPIMTLALFFEKHGCKELISKVLENVTTSSENRQLTDEQESRDLRVLNYLNDYGVDIAQNENYLKNNSKGWIPITQLYHYFQDKFPEYEIHPDYFTRNVLTETLKRFGFHQAKKEGGISWLITRNEVDEVKKRNGYFDSTDGNLDDFSGGSKTSSEGSDTSDASDSGIKSSDTSKNTKFRNSNESSDGNITSIPKSEQSEANEQNEQEVDALSSHKSEVTEVTEVSLTSVSSESSEKDSINGSRSEN